MKKRIAIIGAGVSGLVSIKACLEEGLEVECFEKAPDLGGLWYCRESPEVICVNRTTTTNTSKEMSAFSDFPMPEHYSNFLRPGMLNDYLLSYARKFELTKHIAFETSVLAVTASDAASDGKWKVLLREKDGTEKTKHFDAVMVCTGKLMKPKIPDFEGLLEFEGDAMHVSALKDPTPYYGKRVVVVGNGSSGLDAATVLCQNASQVYLSSRRDGVWLHKHCWQGVPWDMQYYTRFQEILRRYFPRLYYWNFQRGLNTQIDHKFHGLQPRHSVTQGWEIHDDIPYCILSGKVILKPNVRRVTPSGIEFVDGTCEDVDTIIFATGYDQDHSFIKHPGFHNENRTDLYHYAFPLGIEQPTLAFIGLVLNNIHLPNFEMQARWVASVFTGDVKLPSREEMMMVVQEQNSDTKYYTRSGLVDKIYYLNMLATAIGCAPDIGKIFLTDPKLAFKLIFGPCISYQFRLQGRHSWGGARQAMDTVWERMEVPYKHKRKLDYLYQSPYWSIKLLVVVALVIGMLISGCIYT